MLCFEHTLRTAEGMEKKIRIVHGDLCGVTDLVDVVVCSAFKGGYTPTPGTLIGSLIGVSTKAYNKEKEEGRVFDKEDKA